MTNDDTVSLVDAEPPDRYRFDYRGMHRYIITLPVFESQKIFTDRGPVHTVLGALRDCALQHRFDVYAYCFLPDRLELIVRGKDETSMMKEFLEDFRARSSAAVRDVTDRPLWRRKYLERVLRKTEDSKRIAEGLFQLPVKAGLVTNSSEYSFQGSFVLPPDRFPRKR